MTLPRTKSFLESLFPDRSPKPGRRRFRDTPVRNATGAPKTDASLIRLAGYFVGGILLANLVLMASSAFRGHAAQTAAPFPAGISKRADAADAQSTLMVLAADDDSAEPRTPAPGDSEAEPALEAPSLEATSLENPRPQIANICIEARERLVSGLTLYYLQRTRRPYASNEEVLASVEAITLLAGREDPALTAAGASCAG